MTGSTGWYLHRRRGNILLLRAIVGLVAAATMISCAAGPSAANAVRAPHASGAAGRRLEITVGGTARNPKVYSGHGRKVDGITIEADNVVVDGYVMDQPEAPGIEMTGNNITVRNNTISRPRGGDGDGLRFFGSDLKILNNRISGTTNDNGRHADCMQTFASDTPSSRNVLIQGNRCEQADNMCLMAEGPDDGKRTTSNFTIKDNSCQTLQASQNLMFENVQNCVITGNEFTGNPVKAIGLSLGSTGAHVSGNKLGPSIQYEVGLDDSSRDGYQGPEPGGEP